MGRRGIGGQFFAEVAKVAALCDHSLCGLRRSNGLRLLGRGHIHHGTRFDAVDVAVDKGLGVGAQQGHQHLIERDRGWLGGHGDLAGGIAALDGDLTIDSHQRFGWRNRNYSGAGSAWARRSACARRGGAAADRRTRR